MWRLVLAKVVTLQEIDGHWNLLDVAEAHEALDIQREAEEYAYQQAEAKSRGD